MNQSPPDAGSGLHDWILEFTGKQIISGQDEEAVRQRTFKLTQSKGRPLGVLRREIDDAVDGAVNWLEAHPSALGSRLGDSRKRSNWEMQDFSCSDGIRRPPPLSKWVLPVNTRLIETITRRKWPMFHAREHLNLGELYAGINFPICVAKEVNLPRARPLRYWQDRWSLREMQWIVPNPCLRCGNGGGVKSDANAGERVWLIIEFDHGSLEDQAKLLMWLDRIDAEWELAMVVYSGSKSLHGWFSCVGKGERKEICKFFRLATTLCCDRAMRSSVQYTRMPLGWNAKTNRRQMIIHWNEEAILMHTRKLIESQKEDESEW